MMISHIEAMRISLPKRAAESKILIFFGVGPYALCLQIARALAVAEFITLIFASSLLLPLSTPSVVAGGVLRGR